MSISAKGAHRNASTSIDPPLNDAMREARVSFAAAPEALTNCCCCSGVSGLVLGSDAGIIESISVSRAVIRRFHPVDLLSLNSSRFARKSTNSASEY